MRTPSSEMYGDLRTFGGVTNRDAASILLSPTARLGGIELASRLDNRPFLSRKITYAAPGSLDASVFSDFRVSSQTLFSRIVSNLGGANARSLVSAHYAGPAALNMQEAITSCGADAHIYANALGRIRGAKLHNESDRDILYLYLFVACGCLQDPSAAAVSVERFASANLASSLRTGQASVEAPGTAPERAQGTHRLGLLRLEGGSAVPPIHPLSTEPVGTVIGSIGLEDSDITDVGPSVSRRHLRIWSESGTWFAQGLGSTNGTTLTSGETGAKTVVELPSDERGDADERPVVEIANGDVLHLGSETAFLVMSLAY